MLFFIVSVILIGGAGYAGYKVATSGSASHH